MQQNIGLLDRYIRFFSGLVIYGSGVGMRRGSPLAKGTLLTIGAMKMAEGVTGWCPLLQAVGINTLDTQQASQGTQMGNNAGAASKAMMSGQGASTNAMNGAQNGTQNGGQNGAPAQGSHTNASHAKKAGQGDSQDTNHVGRSEPSSVPHARKHSAKDEDMAEGLAALQ